MFKALDLEQTQPFNVATTFDFVQQVLMSIVTICKAEAAALLSATQQTADQIKQALEATQPPSEDTEEEKEAPDGSSRIDAVRAYFEKHHKQKGDAADGMGTADAGFVPGMRQVHSRFACGPRSQLP